MTPEQAEQLIANTETVSVVLQSMKLWLLFIGGTIIGSTVTVFTFTASNRDPRNV